MRVVWHLVRLLAAAATALLITAVFDPAAGLASTQPGFSTQPRITEHPRSAPPNWSADEPAATPASTGSSSNSTAPSPPTTRSGTCPWSAWTAQETRRGSAARRSWRSWSGPPPTTRTTGQS
jgi:hypothetical protein